MKKLWRDQDWLWEQYIVREKSTCAMAKEAGCGGTAILRWLRKFDISIYDRNNLWQDRDWLWEHYITQEKSTYVMAKEAKCAPSTIYCWLHKNNIPVRDLGEAIFFATRNSVIITPSLLEFLGGEIPGDGNVSILPGGRSACYRHSSKYKEYLIWLSERLGEWGIKQAGRITDHKDKETGAIYYHYVSRSYPELVPIYKAWYSKRDGKMKKTVPKGFKLTPIKARQWYIGDGGLKHPERPRPYINLATCDFDRPSIEHLIAELGRLGFGATYQPSDNTINIATHSTKDFLKWIGPCPISCYDYKWDYEKRT